MVIPQTPPESLPWIQPLPQVGRYARWRPYSCQPSSETVLLTPGLAAAAAKIKAHIQARKGIQHVDVPPVKSPSSSTGNLGISAPAGAVSGEMYIADGDYIKDIEVNDLRIKYILTGGPTQKMVNLPLANSC